MVFFPIDLPILALGFHAGLGASIYAATFWFFYRGIVQETWALLRNRDAQPALA